MGFFHRPVGGCGGGETSSSGNTNKNYSKNISASEWILVNNGDYVGMYKKTITHNLNSTDLIIAIYQNGIESMVDVIDIVNSNTIDIYNDEAINCKIVINSGISSFGEVVNYSKNIAVNEWSLVNSGNYSGLYKVTITHNLNSKDLIMAIYKDGIKSMVNIVDIKDVNSVDIYNDEAVDCRIIISSGIGDSSETYIKLKPFSGNSST